MSELEIAQMKLQNAELKLALLNTQSMLISEQMVNVKREHEACNADIKRLSTPTLVSK